jgi:hypothetical protein
MATPSIPARQPVGDPFAGVVLALGELHALALDAPPTGESEGATALHRGACVLRYGARYLGKPHISIVPGLLALDYGDILTGEDAWDFLLNRSNLYPRADVMGYRNDGVDDMVVVKWLDLALTPEVLVYADGAATLPLAAPTALIGPAEVIEAEGGVPARARAYLPRYDSVRAWIDALESKVNPDE